MQTYALAKSPQESLLLAEGFSDVLRFRAVDKFPAQARSCERFLQGFIRVPRSGLRILRSVLVGKSFSAFLG